MLSLALPAGLASALNAEEAEQAVGVTTRCGGITYPAGGWLCPEQLTRAVIALATEQGLQTRFRHTLTSLVAQESRWQLRFTSGETASHETVVLANGHQINRFDQTRPLPVYAVGGQVSHIPT
ncbi:FAD-dependent oxidoreductase, partial [Salmonella enterica subsp. enterica serovar Typhi]|nr:FAD-dependent oxidoreductase [Salmonella enterica subsp. enterica serovar Typhi]